VLAKKMALTLEVPPLLDHKVFIAAQPDGLR
jgi:hypothetical protein